jgi:hypothetical protein
VSISWVAVRRIDGSNVSRSASILASSSELLPNGLLERDARRSPMMSRGCTQQHDLVELWVKQDLSIVRTDDEQHVSVLGRKEFTDPIDIPVLVAVLIDHGVAAVVRFDHLVAKLGKTLSHRRFPAPSVGDGGLMRPGAGCRPIASGSSTTSSRPIPSALVDVERSMRDALE